MCIYLHRLSKMSELLRMAVSRSSRLVPAIVMLVFEAAWGIPQGMASHAAVHRSFMLK